MGKNWLYYLGALVGALAFHTFYFGWYSWFILVLCLSLPIFSFVVSMLAMVQVRLTLDAPTACSRGSKAVVTMGASGSFLPMPRLRFRLTQVYGLTGETQRLLQAADSHGTWYVPLDTSHCGTIRCTAEKLRVYDYLGLVALPVKKPQPVEITVYPVPAPPTRLPNLSQFLARRRKPKPGGGFSEEHELRDYRPGDSMREVHWKLSVKTDRLIVREAQEPIRGLTLLTLDLSGTADQVDSVLGQLAWMSRWLLSHDTVHQILWIDPTDCQIRSALVEQESHLSDLLTQLLHSRLRDNTPSMADRKFPSASWRYHLEPEQEVPS